MAKLLSKNEQPGTQEISKYTETKHPSKALLTPSSMLFLIVLVVCAVSVQASSVLKAVNHPPFELRQALRDVFFVRPPPTLLA